MSWGRAGLRRPSRAAVVAALLAVVAGVAYSVWMTAANYSGPAGDYAGFMRWCASTAILPMSLIATYAFSVRYDAFDRVRRDPRGELSANLVVLVGSGLTAALLGVALFMVVESAASGRGPDAVTWSICPVMLAQLFMMDVSVGLVAFLFVNSGVSFAHVLPVLITVLLLARWFLLPFAGHMERYFFYFWYPISPSLGVVLTRQAAPFLGFCILLAGANVLAFERTDRLDG